MKSQRFNGEAQIQRGNESGKDETISNETPLENPTDGAFGESSNSGSLKPVPGQKFTSDYVDGNREQDELEIAQIQLEMERLKAEEARLERKKDLNR